MNSIKSVDKDTITAQIKSIFVFEFLDAFNELETEIRRIFENSILSDGFPPEIIHKLYFYYGGRIGTYIEYEESAIKLNKLLFKEDEKFTDLTINQLLRIFKSTNSIKPFNFEIESTRYPTVSFTFYDCALKLISMRNKLAHRIRDVQFKDNKDLIELISIEKLDGESFSMLQNYDLSNMDDTTRFIASNLFFMRKMIKHLNSSQEFS